MRIRIDEIETGQRYRRDLDIDMTDNGLIVINQATGNRQMFATSHFFFNDHDMTPVAHIDPKNGIAFFSTEIGRNADRKREANLAQLRSRPAERGQEKQVELQIANQLETLGVSFQRQKKCRYGIIDIFIDGNPPCIIELKANQSQESIRQAIGQLAFYSFEYPAAKLFICTPSELEKDIRTIIARFGIEEWRGW